MANIDLGQVETFTTGTIGPKGQRVFYLQAQSQGDTFVFQLEKQQVLAMAEHLGGLLSDLPEINAHEWTSAPTLAEPVNPIWTIGAMGAMYASTEDNIVIMAEEIAEDPDAHDSDTATLRLGLGQTAAFIERALEIVNAGRPPCQYCSRPLNYGENEFCPCWN